MKRRFRLTRSTDFKRVRRTGKSYAHPLVVLVVEPEDGEVSQFGVAAGRSVGNAVERNRAKRRLRAILDELQPHLTAPYNVVLLARQPIAQAEFKQIRSAVIHLFQRARLLDPSCVEHQ